ncbi:hypothetical protein OEZ86_009782 [Tetradesmus obliquus]|uniref:Uncharacterized protein n=1 Tax=Tetradesmus obliquus TaxID=3088 RepID=A0ABY8UPE7_TETOB|nr:hypothetical protein OEZ85_001224 [Tetradesmus obliquus]WIA43280.1 hypothetical protein OEZ86_009782 [Tetradesmus obliquus]
MAFTAVFWRSRARVLVVAQAAEKLGLPWTLQLCADQCDADEALWHCWHLQMDLAPPANLLYFTAGIIQLAVLLLAPAQHQRHRFAVNLANRLVKAVTVTWAVSNMSQASVMQQFASVLNLSHAGAPHSVHMELLRFIATPCLIW